MHAEKHCNAHYNASLQLPECLPQGLPTVWHTFDNHISRLKDIKEAGTNTCCQA